MTTPTSIYGSIILKTNANFSTANFPGFTYDPSLPFTPANTLNSSLLPKELAARASAGTNATGITADYVSHLFFRNDSYTLNYLNTISGFIPDYYITVGKEVGLSLKSATGGVTLSSGPGSGNDRFEVIQFNYSTDVFLKDGGGSGIAMTGFTYSHSIYPGNTYVSGNQIFYRKLGRVSS